MIQAPSTVIENVEQLKEYLQVAIQLEHAVIPPYLTAAYSAKIESNRDAIEIMLAVAKEEMLHLTLAANLLNAIGGQPDLISPDFVPHYPTHLPTGQDDFDVGIEKFSNHALEIFLSYRTADFARNPSTRKLSSTSRKPSPFRANTSTNPCSKTKTLWCPS